MHVTTQFKEQSIAGNSEGDSVSPLSSPFPCSLWSKCYSLFPSFIELLFTYKFKMMTWYTYILWNDYNTVNYTLITSCSVCVCVYEREREKEKGWGWGERREKEGCPPLNKNLLLGPEISDFSFKKIQKPFWKVGHCVHWRNDGIVGNIYVREK